MRKLLAALIGSVLGIIAGMVITSLVGIVSYFVFDHPIGMKYLPIYLGAAGIAVGLLIERRSKQKQS